jgi:hypothetical protein
VPTTSGQIGALLEQPGLAAIEVSVDALLDDTRQMGEIDRVARAVDELLLRDEDAVICQPSTHHRHRRGAQPPERTAGVGQPRGNHAQCVAQATLCTCKGRHHVE